MKRLALLLVTLVVAARAPPARCRPCAPVMSLSRTERAQRSRTSAVFDGVEAALAITSRREDAVEGVGIALELR